MGAFRSVWREGVMLKLILNKLNQVRVLKKAEVQKEKIREGKRRRKEKVMFHHVLLLLLMIFRVCRFHCPLAVGRSVALCVSWIHNGEIFQDYFKKWQTRT